jgi:hypothetical protein
MYKCSYCTLYQGKCNPKSKECEKASDRYLKQKANWEKEINKEALEWIKNIIEDIKSEERK